MKSRLFLSSASVAIVVVIVLAVVLAFLNTPPTQAAMVVRYVAPGGLCGSGNPCYATLQSGVDAADAGDEIRIAEGVYTEVNHYAGLAQLVYLSKTITLRGGYSTNDWENSTPVTHPTVLDAQSAGRGLYVIGFISPTIENLSVVHGDATGLGGTPRFQGDSAGGGLYVISATVTLRDTLLKQNYADEGGAVYCQNSRLSLFDSTIFSNTGTIGGGVFFERSQSALINNTIEGNRAGDGGGVAVYDGRAELSGNRILSNWSSTHGGGVLFAGADGLLVGNIITGNVGQTGGGASLSGNITILRNAISQNSGEVGGGLVLGDGNISLIGNTITDNSSSFIGGGVAISFFSFEGDPNMKIIADNVISGNTSVTGGGLSFQHSRPTLMRNLIQDNQAQETGGGIYALESHLSMDGDTVVGNTSHGNGGGLALSQFGQSSLTNMILADNQTDGDGGGLYIDRNSVDVVQATFANNRGRTGVYVGSGSELGPSWLTMTNTIMASHTVAISATVNSTATLRGVLWFGNETMISGAGTYIIADMIHGDPAFVSGGYRLSASSAAIDSGVASNVLHDIDLQPRPYRQFDLGADEFWPNGVLRQVYLPIVH